MKSIYLVFCFFVTVLCSDESDKSDKSEQLERAKISIILRQLYTAIKFENVTGVQSLIEKGAPLNHQFFGELRSQSYPLHYSVSLCEYNKFNEEIFNLLIKNGANLEAANRDGHTALYEAAFLGNVKAAQILLENGANPNVQSPMFRHTVLHIAFHHSHDLTGEDIVDLLIEYGADVNQSDSRGVTVLYQAIAMGYQKAVEMLIERGANVNVAVHQWKETPLHQIASFDYSSSSPKNWTEDDLSKFADLLIGHGADINHLDSLGRTPLHQAIITGHKKVTELLIESGADVNAKENIRKMTALHYIASYDSFDRGHENWTDDDRLKFAELLINHGADLYAKASFLNDDMTPFDMTTSPKLEELLESKMNFVGWIKSMWN